MKEFITEKNFEDLMQKTQQQPGEYFRDIIYKAEEKKGLSIDDVAFLLCHRNPDNDEIILETAKKIKNEIYGRRIVLFAPLYLGNECVNDCVYCGFRISNRDCIRTSLDRNSILEEVKSLLQTGHKRLIVVFGEHPKYSPERIKESVELVYSIKSEKANIRRLNINAAPFDVEGFSIIKEAGIGTYQIFQETYHKKTYNAIHPSGPKSDYFWRLYAHDRSMKAGIDDVGLGTLLGLYDWKYELLSLLAHSFYLENEFGVGPHTISFPRIEPAFGSSFSENPPHQINDHDFKIFVALLRIAVPYTGLILTAREPETLRNELISIGISQIDAGSSIGVGDYSSSSDDSYKKSQFILGDKRSLDHVIHELVKQELIPSFCTGCYRLGRTGETFMSLSKPGEIKTFCQANAILTFAEYLEDFSSDRTKASGEKLLEREISTITDTKIKLLVQEKIVEIKKGKRDLYI